MGKLVEFDKRRREGKRATPSQKPEGQVVLFTGVRYERGTTQPDKPPAAAGRKRKRV